MVNLSVNIANIALPQAQIALGLADTQRQWIISGYTLAFAALLLLGGRLGDLFERRRMLVIGLLGFALASALAGAAWSFPVLIAGRVLQGASGAVLAPATLSILATTFTEPGERARAFGVFSAISGAGAGIGLLAGGALTRFLSWRWCFFLLVPFALAAVAGAVIVLGGTASGEPGRGGRVDAPGAILAVLGLSSLVFGASQVAVSGWLSVRTVGLFAAAVVLLGVFVLVESRVRVPLLPLDVLASRIRVAGYLSIVVPGLAAAGVFYFITFYLQRILGFDALTAGLGFMPMVVATIVAAMLANAVLLPRIGARAIVPLGMLIGASGALWLSLLTPTSSYWTTLAPALAVVGLGYGIVFASGMATSTLGLRPDHAGAGSGVVSTLQQFGTAIGTSLLSSVALARTGAATDPASTVAGYTAAFRVGGAVFLAGAVLAVLLFPSGSARDGAS